MQPIESKKNILAPIPPQVFNDHEERKVDCKRCGKCCHADMIAYATEEDISRWRREKRDDILSSLESEERIWVGDRILYRDGSGHLERCSFLRIEEGLATCTIHETRPRICRDYEAGSSLLCPLHEVKHP